MHLYHILAPLAFLSFVSMMLTATFSMEEEPGSKEIRTSIKIFLVEMAIFVLSMVAMYFLYV